MKSILTTIILVIFSIGNTFAQLPTDAQRIYDSCNVNNPGNVSYAATNGVQIIATPDGKSFYLKWIPVGLTYSTTPLIVTLHGSKGNAFNEFKSWHTSAQTHSCAIIALQYNKYTDIFDFANGYFQDDTIYNYIDTALTRISYPSNKALLHGFSLGSARTYAVIYNDIQSGNNYFCSTISNAGKIDLTYPLYYNLNTIPNVFIGKHWNLFCGPPETIVAGDSCGGLDFTQTWLQSKGAIVDIYIKNPGLGHSGFQLTSSSAYKDTMLNKYLECYNGTTSIVESVIENSISIFPNPFSVQATIHTNSNFKNAILSFYNIYGQQVKQINNINENIITINRDNLPNGLYLINLTDGNKVIMTKKLVIQD